MDGFRQTQPSFLFHYGLWFILYTRAHARSWWPRNLAKRFRYLLPFLFPSAFRASGQQRRQTRRERGQSVQSSSKCRRDDSTPRRHGKTDLTSIAARSTIPPDACRSAAQRDKETARSRAQHSCCALLWLVDRQVDCSVPTHDRAARVGRSNAGRIL